MTRSHRIALASTICWFIVSSPPARAASIDDDAWVGKNDQAPATMLAPGVAIDGTEVRGTSYTQSDFFGNERFQAGYDAELWTRGRLSAEAQAVTSHLYANGWAKMFGKSFGAFTITAELRTSATGAAPVGALSLYVAEAKVREETFPGGLLTATRVWLSASNLVRTESASFTAGPVPITVTAQAWAREGTTMQGRLWRDGVDGLLTMDGDVRVLTSTATALAGAEASHSGDLTLLELSLPTRLHTTWAFGRDVPSGGCAVTLAESVNAQTEVTPLVGTVTITGRLGATWDRTIARWTGARQLWSAMSDTSSAPTVIASCPVILPAPPDNGAAHAPPGCQPLAVVDGIVSRDASQLRVSGQRYRALGGNTYYLQQMFTYSLQDNDPGSAAQGTDALDAMVCMGIQAARMWGFNDTTDRSSIRSAPALYHEDGLRGLDRAVAEAKARGLRAIIALVNNHAAYGGLPTYAAWAGKSHDDFFTDPTMKQYWKDYAATLLNRVNTFTGVAYRNEPAILAWEIGNEIRCDTCTSSEPVNGTLRELASFLRQQGASQLIADGSDGMDDDPSLYPGLSNTYAVRGEVHTSFSKLVHAPELDMVSYHTYPGALGINPTTDIQIWIDSHETLAREAGKVAYLGEFGFDAPAATRDATRAPVYADWLSRLFDRQDSSVAAVWQIFSGARVSTDDGYGVIYGSHPATTAVLADEAAALR